MAENSMEYILNLKGNLDEKLTKILVTTDKQLDIWGDVQLKISSADKTMGAMGKTIGSLNARIAALRAQKEWIPASNMEAIRNTNLEIKALEQEIEDLNNLNGGKVSGWFEQLKDAVPALGMITNPLVLAAAATHKLSGYIKESKQAYLEESVETTKLTKLMQNNMQATEGEVNAILDLASAQQKLGVVGDETQIAGAQELATYLDKADSLQKLIPSMNDMLAQQYGLNATQEQAVTIAQMMGKVLDGQTGALRRYGYSFTDAQEKVLKYGNETKKVAMLSKILQQYVGGVNEALANTPEGKLQQQANNMGDLQERVGKLAVAAEAAFSPVIAKIGEVIDNIISFFEECRDSIMSSISAAATVVGFLVQVLGKLLEIAVRLYPITLSLATGMTAYAVATKLHSLNVMAASKGTTLWQIAQKKLNLEMMKNPVFLIAAGVALLIVGIIKLVDVCKDYNAEQKISEKLTGDVAYKVSTEKKEMNSLFDALQKTNPKSKERKELIEQMKEKYPDFLDYQKLETANELELETARKKANDELARTIRLQAYKEQKEASVKEIESTRKEYFDAMVKKGYSPEEAISALDKVQNAATAEIAAGNWSGTYNNGNQEIRILNTAFGDKVNGHYTSDIAEDFAHRTFSKDLTDFADAILSAEQKVKSIGDYVLASGGTQEQLFNAVTGKTDPEKKTTTDAVTSATESVATGGSKSTTINITLRNLVEQINYQGGYEENRDKTTKTLEEDLFRVLQMAYQTV